MTRLRSFAAVTVALLFVAWVAQPAFAVKPLLPLLCKAFDLNSEEMTCKVCHTYNKENKEKPGEKNINAFARDLKHHPALAKVGEFENDRTFTEAEQAIIIQAMKDIGRYDSDGDGASNIEELKLGSNPGDATKKPDDTALANYRKEHPETTPVPKPATASSNRERKSGSRGGHNRRNKDEEDDD